MGVPNSYNAYSKKASEKIVRAREEKGNSGDLLNVK